MEQVPEAYQQQAMIGPTIIIGDFNSAPTTDDLMDNKYGQAACDGKREEPELPVEKGQAQRAQTPGAKRKLTVQ